MKLVVGLGNPGGEYEQTRHNVGFRVVDELARRFGTTFRKGPFRYRIAEVPSADLTLLKPMTYMNRSGAALREWSSRTGTPLSMTGETDDIAPIVVCDDLALPLGSLRIRSRGSAGGQKGLASIIAAFGGERFPRVRLGIAGGDGVVPPDAWSDYVLDPFTSAERDIVADLIDYAADAVAFLLEKDVQEAANRFNRRFDPVDD